jgi:hypothetical protein
MKTYLNITGNGVVEGVTCRQANCLRQDALSIVFIFENIENDLFWSRDLSTI